MLILELYMEDSRAATEESSLDMADIRSLSNKQIIIVCKVLLSILRSYINVMYTTSYTLT